MKLILRPEAEAELLEAIDWYEARGRGLGADLLRCVDACLQRIVRNPDAFPFVHRSIRMAVVRRFPYLVLFRMMEDAVSVIAIFHAKRNPRIWKDR
ncbi:MAG TPA: type II toxin-antitoxin system RelE/ParE family toxin [Candidatus Paceibacterota bacterium]|nr:type II toxin-antitoxin system RelE/ParE family toxin [Verrucomicrobiota bacterium]HRY49520.1 type II toxin-antitoxin system RelE/ParE family toxin [Candidatus Paceibacterota bacterium]